MRGPKPVSGRMTWPRGYVTGLLTERDEARGRAERAEAEVVRLREVLLRYEHQSGSHRGARDKETHPCPACREEFAAYEDRVLATIGEGGG